MSGTFVATPSKALTIEHEPTSRALTQFKPEETRGDLVKIDVLAAYGAKLRDDTKLHELAVRKLEVIVDIVDWWGQNVYGHGESENSRNLPHQRKDPAGSSRISASKAMEILGYSPNTNAFGKWNKMAAEARKDLDAMLNKIMDGWKIRAGMLAPPDPKTKPENEDRDLAVESIFRAYTKLDPDQRIELKQKIMAFEKSYKDPFAPKAV